MTFEVPEETRETFISKNIVAKLPEKEREEIKPKVEKIVSDFEGRDMDALSVLSYAAERGRMEEFMERLESHYQESLQYLHPEARKVTQVPGAVRAEHFFLKCYQNMEIKPQKE